MYKVQLDVESFVRGEILKCKSFALERKVTFVFKSSVGSMSIYSDVKLLQSAIGNVLHNAVKFNKTHGAAYVELSKMVGKDKSESLVIEITDEGEGISEKAKVSLFESFVQGEDHLTRQHEGLGAGMFLAKRALGFLGGSISVTSELTKGSMFRIVLPTAREGAVI